jgi:hypothetical protein
MSEQVVLDREAPPWAQRLQTDINALMTRLDRRVKTVNDALSSSGTGLQSQIDDLVADVGALPEVTIYTSPQQTITSGGLLTLAHGLGGVPDWVQPHLVCNTAEANYSVNDVVILTPNSNAYAANAAGVSIVPDATNLVMRYGSAANAFHILNKTSGAAAVLTNANWRFVVKAFRWT